MVSSPAGHARSDLAWAALRLLLGLEALGLLLLVGFTIVRSIAESGAVAQEISIVLMSVAAFVWVAVTFVGVTRSRTSWSRSSAVAIHVLTFAGGTGCLQLGIGPWWLGVGIVVIALIGFGAAIFARPEAPATQ